MSLIQIDKKAVTRAEARKVLEASLALPDPFGVPTVVFQEADFGLTHLTQLDDKKKISSLLRTCEKLYPLIKAFDCEERVLNYLKAMAKDQPIFQAVAIRKFSPGFEGSADGYAPGTYQGPVSNVVVMPSVESAIYQYDCGIDALDLPGFIEEWQFNTLWHEYAHGVGAGEPQADAISGVMTRRAFQDNHVLMACADHHALRAIFYYAGVEQRGRYGWGMVEVNDYIASLSDELLNGISEEDIRRMRFHKVYPLVKDISQVGSMLKTANPEAFRKKNHSFFVDDSKGVSSTNNLTSSENRVLKRFQLACARISHGKAAYVEGNDLVDPALLAVTREPPMTFTPGGFIPS